MCGHVVLELEPAACNHFPWAYVTMVRLERGLLTAVCLTSALLSVAAHKKPTFCDQEGDPFSFLWVIKRDPPSYLFGTIHVPYTKVWNSIPENAKQAFESCSTVFFELDLMDPDTVSGLSTCQMLPQGKNLSEVLPEDLYDRLKRHLEYIKGMMPLWMTEDQKGRGMYADYLFKAIAGNWERKRPVWVMLMVNSLTESDIRSRGVPVLDLYLAQEAERMKKRTGAVEKVEEQCLPLNGLNLSQVLFALNHTLTQHEELREGDLHASYTTDDLIRHYNCGDLDAVIFSQDTTQVPNLSNSTLTEEDAAVARNIDMYFRQELIYNRNHRMGNRVAELLNRNPGQSLFFAFGAGHFLGNNTVLDFLQTHGFEIEHLSVHSKIAQGKQKIPPRPTSLVKTLFRTSGFLNSEKKGVKDDPRWRNGNNSPGRRTVRRKMPAVSFSTRFFTTTSKPQPVTPRSRLFNDLWVRLDDYHRQTSHLSDGTTKLDSHLLRSRTRFRPSHGNSSSGSTPTFNSSIVILALTLSFLCCCRNLTFNSVVSFTGIT